MNDPWLYWRSGMLAPALNMAWDALLLGDSISRNLPVIRFYGWTEPAATFGYFQRYSEVADQIMLRPLIRRPTGGGIVPHDADWTYSVAVPATHSWHRLSATESYERIHDWVARAFGRIGVEASLAPCCRKEIPGQCFAGYEKSDVLWQGRKIAGAAQRRTRDGLLIQGSIQPPPLRLNRVEWEEAFLASGTVMLGCTWEQFCPTKAQFERAEILASSQFGSDAFNQRRA